MNIKIVFEKSEDGSYTVYVPSLQVSISELAIRDDIENIREDIELYIEPFEDNMLQYQN